LNPKKSILFNPKKIQEILIQQSNKMAKNILIKPLVTEKSETMAKLGQYVFKVAKDANKIQIQKAVEDMFNVAVTAVNTAVLPGKTKTRQSKSSVMRGQKPSFKKAYVTLAKGEKLEFFGSADEEVNTDDV
jgi:large subunit ribosomal protein L23